MFGKSRRERIDLEQHGRQAQAVVVDISGRGMAITRGADTIVSNTEVVLKTKLRVEPDNEPAFEVQQRFHYPQTAVPRVGTRLNVRYDPDDHDHIMIDRSASRMRVGNTDIAGLLGAIAANPQDPAAAARTVMDQLGIRDGRGATVIVGGASMPGAPHATNEDPIDKLEKLARLRDTAVLTEAEFQTQKARILGESA